MSSFPLQAQGVRTDCSSSNARHTLIMLSPFATLSQALPGFRRFAMEQLAGETHILHYQFRLLPLVLTSAAWKILSSILSPAVFQPLLNAVTDKHFSSARQRMLYGPPASHATLRRTRRHDLHPAPRIRLCVEVGACAVCSELIRLFLSCCLYFCGTEPFSIM